MALTSPLVMLLLTLVSFGMLTALAVLWWRTWRETRSAFSLGLVLFALILAFQEVTRLLRFGTGGPGRPPALFDFRALEFFGVLGQVVALGILLYFVAR